jgi:hypothetical protein
VWEPISTLLFTGIQFQIKKYKFHFGSFFIPEIEQEIGDFGMGNVFFARENRYQCCGSGHPGRSRIIFLAGAGTAQLCINFVVIAHYSTVYCVSHRIGVRIGAASFFPPGSGAVSIIDRAAQS